MSALPSRRYRVVVLEWVSKEEAEAIGLDLWNQADTA